MNYINGQFIPLQIPIPVVDQELTPLSPPPPGHATALQLWNQIPNELKLHGFGYYMRLYDYDEWMTNDQYYWSYIANYYYFNSTNEICSFYDWQGKVQAKVGGYRFGSDYSDFVDFIIDEVEAERLSFAKGTYDLFSRRQLSYFGW